ncbi:hypothetical protein K470DRAFT_285197 [Piedraia hortae CBS 480.64]|uniref:DUF7924 domain-containing protein n=1 Tax=Piedraia hortae CBS 480.64 TaxID=1314780 RepID=A0A6A7C3C0_9PEZI|nr:hypothetical protein K470DRAFT_285197 [Piedraia hortae CBS 480.64]
MSEPSNPRKRPVDPITTVGPDECKRAIEMLPSDTKSLINPAELQKLESWAVVEMQIEVSLCSSSSPMGQESVVQWERRIGGKIPKPDFAYGLQKTAFDKNVWNQLDWYEKYRPTRFTRGGLYFPFFVCELKAKDVSLDHAHVQACSAAATMVDAVRQLCQVTKPDEVDSLEGQILGSA